MNTLFHICFCFSKQIEFTETTGNARMQIRNKTGAFIYKKKQTFIGFSWPYSVSWDQKWCPWQGGFKLPVRLLLT